MLMNHTGVVRVIAANKLLIVKTLCLLTDLVESIGVEGVSRSRKIYHESLNDIIHLTLRLFPSFIHQPGMPLSPHLHTHSKL